MHRSFLLFISGSVLSFSAFADVVINEVMSGGSERLLRWDANGVPKVGFGAPWYAGSFNDSSWQSGTGPFGFGSFANVSPAPTVSTNTATQMQNLTPTCYLRKTFTVSSTDAARGDTLNLEVKFNDGFVCYLNGVEVVRRNAGPTKGFIYKDQFAAAGTPANTEVSTTPYLRTETLSLGTASSKLVSGTNVIAIHALNFWEGSTLHRTSDNMTVSVDNRNNFYFSGDLKIATATPITLVANNTSWKYLPGVVEASGGLYDPTLLFQGKQNVPWGKASFDDTTWSAGTAPFGAGTPPSGVTLGTNLSSVPGTASSVYFRTVFNVNATALADPKALQLLMDWDDGFVAYINGVEVARDRLDLANSFTPYNAVASSVRNGGSTSTYTIDPPARLLQLGQNVLSIQLHNVSLADADIYLNPLLRTNNTGTNMTLVPNAASWKYFIGATEPIETFDENLEDSPEGPDSSLDWMELHNNGASAVALDGWRVSDDPLTPAKWTFPAGVSIPAGGYLLLACDDLNITAPASGGFYHTNFKLGNSGETLVLSDSTGAVVSQVTTGIQTAFESYGRTGAGTYLYYSEPSPGVANSGSTLTDQVAPVTFSLAAGFYSSTQTVTLSTTTSGASIRYTTDGTEPTSTTGTAGSSVTVSTSRSIRARAFKAGSIPSAVSTRTYLINEPSGRQGVPALCLAGSEQRSLYRPFGIMAISGGAYPNFASPAPTSMNSIWTQASGAAGSTVADLSAYNMPVHRGRFVEKPVNMELLRSDNTPGPNMEFGMRVSGSSHARPRYQLANQNRVPGASPAPNEGVWNAIASQKPSFNFFFRNDLGGDPLNYPLFPNYPVTSFHDVRVRAGKNDASNPFVEDEFMRRLFINTGQQGSRGMINTLYINGVYKGYYNLCEHIREDFLQRHHGGKNAWDVRQVTTIASGDGLAFQEMITFIRNNPQSVLANYQGMKTRLDMVNFVDYLCVNLLGNTGDWPHNNFVCAKERVAGGLHRYYLWDAEGAFGDFGGNHVRTNMFVAGNTAAIVTASPQTAGLGEGIRVLYTLLRDSPEFKLLFADRLQKHFFNGGVLAETKVFNEWNTLKTEFAPLIAPTAVTDRVTPWLNGVGNTSRYTTSGSTTTNEPSRRKVLFEGYIDDTAGGATVQAHLVAEGLWPTTLAPSFSQNGGTVSPGYALTISHSNATGTIYYTRNGADPRAEGGTVAGSAYVGALTLNYPGTIKARVRSTAGVWSPLLEAYFDTGTNEPLIISEVMYHPAPNGLTDGDEYEFIEIKNTSTEVIQLSGMTISPGVTYTFPEGSSIPAGGHVVIAKSALRFAERYPTVTLFDSWGSSATSLANNTDTVTLTNRSGRVIFSMTYTDAAPWPASADGSGYSIVPVNPNIVAVPNNAIYWRASTNGNGSPGVDDPTPALPVYINEVLANATGGTGDWVELYNPNTQSVDISHWWLSDNNTTPQKYRIADGTIIPAGGYMVFTEAQFATGAVPFSFSAAGERVRISAGNAAGALTGFVDNFAFNGSNPGVTFGRQTNSAGSSFLVAQKQPTQGAVNAGPIIGPVVMTELMYNPATGGDEFVELRNISSQAVPLFDPALPANTWKMDGFTWTFPTNVTLQPGQIIIVTALAPTTFRTKYSVPASIAIYGAYTGTQDNGGERLRLQKPGTPFLDDLGATVIPYIDVDAVTYDDISPWPITPDGTGPSLERINAYGWADEPLNWQASSANAGNPGQLVAANFATWLGQHFTNAQMSNPNIGTWGADPDQDGLNNFREWAHGMNPNQHNLDPITYSTQQSGGQTYLHLHIPRSLTATGLQVQADTSTNLSQWSLGAGTLISPSTVNGDGTETLTFRHPTPLSSGTRQFIRGSLSAP